MANSNIKQLHYYLSQQLDETYDELRELERELHTNSSTTTNHLIEIVKYRKAFLLKQIDNIIEELSDINK